MKAKINIKNIYYYLQGNLRYWLYYNHPGFLSKHIFDQIWTRINSMDKECYKAGQCKMCGCQTTALQMSNKACDKPCYPRMLDENEWWHLNKVGFFHEKESGITWSIDLNWKFKQL